MQADEMRDAQVAMFNTPSGTGQARAAVGRANRVGASDDDPSSRCARLLSAQMSDAS
jgi:hypothetical protein